MEKKSLRGPPKHQTDKNVLYFLGQRAEETRAFFFSFLLPPSGSRLTRVTAAVQVGVSAHPPLCAQSGRAQRFLPATRLTPWHTTSWCVVDDPPATHWLSQTGVCLSLVTFVSFLSVRMADLLQIQLIYVFFLSFFLRLWRLFNDHWWRHKNYHSNFRFCQAGIPSVDRASPTGNIRYVPLAYFLWPLCQFLTRPI